MLSRRSMWQLCRVLGVDELVGGGKGGGVDVERREMVVFSRGGVEGVFVADLMGIFWVELHVVEVESWKLAEMECFQDEVGKAQLVWEVVDRVGLAWSRRRNVLVWWRRNICQWRWG